MPLNNTQELRGFLIGALEGVASGEMTPEAARGIARLSQQIYNTMNLELKAARSKATLGDSFDITPIEF